MADGASGLDPPVKVKQEKADEPDEPVFAGGVAAKPTEQPVKLEEILLQPTVKEEVRVKAEKTDHAKEEQDAVKNETVKNETGSLKVETQQVKRELKKDEQDEEMKREAAKREAKGEVAKGEGSKKEGDLYALAKHEQLKAEDGLKREMKRERSRSPKDKKKKKEEKKKDKIKKEKRSASRGKKDKKKKRSKSPEGPRKRRSKWGPDTGGFSLTAIPAGRSGLMPLPSIEETMPKLSEDELVIRTIVLENLSLSVTGQELIEFFNGAVLAVTANAVQQASNRQMAPVFACTVTEEDRGGNDKRKTAELRFRTPEGASVGMKLNGIEYKGAKVNIKRPENYPKPEDGIDPSTKINLHEMSMAKLVGGNVGSGRVDTGPAPKLSIFNLPEVMTEQIVRDLLSQFGKLRMLSLIRDLATGKIKGYGIFEYDDPNDVDLAIIALNGFVCGQNVIRVQKLGGAAQQAQPKPQPVAATAMSNSMTQKIVSNPVLAMQVKQGREVGSRPSTVVQLLNAVYQEDLMDDQDYEDITAEVHSEASKHGTVTRVVIPKPAKDGSFVDGVGKIFVSFMDLTAARKFQMDANGRKFENRVVCAAFYPVDKFNDGKYKLWST
mmetsp:Transcript_118225/g.329725  ORF Transcript_118225/g.329725 Transcript_118225/m.329725 type:complete len:608 (+) Transcript_118225:123-1946(+)